MLTPRAVVLHLTILVVVPLFAALCDWQVHRALSGNGLSWAYVFEWPFFAGYAVYLWWKLLHEPAASEGSEGEVVAGASGVGGQAARGQASGPAGLEGIRAGANGALEVAAPGDASGHRARRSVSSEDGTPLQERQGHEGKRRERERREREEREAEEMAAYNRYLAELDASHARKAW